MSSSETFAQHVKHEDIGLTFTTLWANSADDKLMIFLFFFAKKYALKFHANCLQRNNLHEMSKPIFLKNLKQQQYFKLFSNTQSVKQTSTQNSDPV